MQQAYDDYNRTTRKISNEQWAALACRIVIKTSMKHWKERNDMLHKSKIDEFNEKLKVKEMIKEVQKTDVHYVEKGIENMPSVT